MQMDTFLKTARMFADPGRDVALDGESMLICVNDETICVSLSQNMGEVFVTEGDVCLSAPEWIVKRLAHLSILASRVLDVLKDEAKSFISASANVSDRGDDSRHADDALVAITQILDKDVPGFSSATYLTCDAGGGKTWLISEVAKRQAQLYIDKKSDWLLVPIPLGGRQFLRFDDITAGVLHNKYRFPYLYFESFLALVRMGVIVPAFDGFEEMFVESNSGEANSALSSLLRSLNSAGRVLISARKAYYEFEDLNVRDSIFDTMADIQVVFSKVELTRWSAPQFVAYATKRNVPNPRQLYDRISDVLGDDHSLLTRPVLVKSLIDLAMEDNVQGDFLENLKEARGNYFEVFVEKLIEREVSEKWIDRSGADKVGRPLISIKEHIMLLGLVALEMWEGHTAFLKKDSLEFVADYFSEIYKKNIEQAEQIRKRLYGHALLVPVLNKKAVEFEHEEFRNFFLGHALADILKEVNQNKKVVLHNYLRIGMLPKDSIDAFCRQMMNLNMPDRIRCAKYLVEISHEFSATSFVVSNISAVILQLLDRVSSSMLTLNMYSFPMQSLRNITLRDVIFKNCHFGMSSLGGCKLERVRFEECSFDKIMIDSVGTIHDVEFVDCNINAVLKDERDYRGWAPEECIQRLEMIGCNVINSGVALPPSNNSEEYSYDPRIESIEKIITAFLRRNSISENVIRMKLGNKASEFLTCVIPDLIKLNVMAKREASGGSTQSFYGFCVALSIVRHAIVESKGNYDKLKEILSLKDRVDDDN